MHTRRIAGALVLAGLAWGGSGEVAHAGETPEQRLERLEEALRLQAEQIAELRAELAARRAATSPGTPTPSAPPAPGASPGGAAPPVTVNPALPPAPPPPPAAGAVVDGVGGPPADATRARARERYVSPGGVRWGGYATIEFIAPSNQNSHFDLQRLVLTFDAAVTKCIDVRGEVEFEHGGIGGPLDGEVIVEQAEIVFRLADWFRPKAGALLVPFGRSNLYHDDPMHDFTLRPWTARFLIPTGWGVPGVGFEGAAPVGCHTLTYDVVLNNGVKDAWSSNDGIRPARLDWEADNNENKQLWGRAAMAWRVPCLARLETGVSFTYGKYDDADRNALTGWAVDLLARWGPIEVKGEHIRHDLERDAADPVGAIEGCSGTWAEIGYHFFPSFLCGCRSCLVEDTSHFTLAVRWQNTNLNDQILGAAFRDDLDSIGVALNYRITERTVIRVDYTWFDAELLPDVEELSVSLSTYF
jgi:hypothetical protein